MACVKWVNRSASVAFSADGSYMAAGTMAGAVDLSFSSSASLEIFKLDFQSDDPDIPVVAEHPSAERFNPITWGKNGSGSDQFSHGLVAGGLVDGSIDVYNPAVMISGEAGDGALVGHLSRHKGPVRGLEFNTFTPNLLASGADDCEICIWDMVKPTEPSHFPPLKGSGPSAQGEISYLSWNSKVQHILASTSYNGTTVVWDLKKQKPVISFSDSNKRRCSVLQWNPDLATQLVVASDDDSSPSLRLWDMRNTMSPLKEFVGHTKGVIAMAWCPSDNSYLLTCAKDNRTICWDTVTGEIVCELPAGNNWNFDVHWYSKIPGVISASSFDGKIGLYNIEACDRYAVAESSFGTVPLRAPKWYKRPAGASFGFGGKLVSFHPKSAAGSASEVYVHNLVTEESLLTRSSEFNSAMQNGEKSALRSICDKKSQESKSEDEKETWSFLKVMFEEDGTARTKLLTHLGFSLPPEEKEIVQNLPNGVTRLQLEDTVAGKVGHDGVNEGSTFLFDNGEDFFNNLPSPRTETPKSTSGENYTNGATTPGIEHAEREGADESIDSSFNESVQRALAVGDYKEAVALCISANKMADALVIAHAGGNSLWESTRDQYFKLSRSPYLKVVAAMVNNDLMSLVNTRPLKFWKETLAVLCTFAAKEEWATLCDALASKLMSSGNMLAATLCFMCAGNIDKTVEIWSKCLSSEQNEKSHVDLLQDLMEKTIVLVLATGQKRFSASLCKVVENYAEILASQGLLSTAMEYLKLLGGEELSPELAILKDRIAVSSENEKVQTVSYENTQQLNGAIYGAHNPGFGASDASKQYYQEPAPAQTQLSISSNQYAENFQQPYGSMYGRFGAPAEYQTPSQPAMFLPSQGSQPLQENFAHPPVTAQPAVKPFVPAPSPVLKNAEQYQHPTLGSQLYAGSTNATYQPVPPVSAPAGLIQPQLGAAPGPRMPQVMASTTAPRGFMPINNAGVAQRPNVGPMQPPSPRQAAPVQSAVNPPAPAPTIQTVETSNVAAHQKPVITTLTRLYNETSEVLGGSRANPAKKREIEDNSRKLGALFAKLNNGDISKNAAEKLVQLCQALDSGDFTTALQIQVLLTTSNWDECNLWLATLKRMIKTRQNVRLS